MGKSFSQKASSFVKALLPLGGVIGAEVPTIQAEYTYYQNHPNLLPRSGLDAAVIRGIQAAQRISEFPDLTNLPKHLHIPVEEIPVYFPYLSSGNFGPSRDESVPRLRGSGSPPPPPPPPPPLSSLPFVYPDAFFPEEPKREESLSRPSPYSPSGLDIGSAAATGVAGAGSVLGLSGLLTVVAAGAALWGAYQLVRSIFDDAKSSREKRRAIKEQIAKVTLALSNVKGSIKKVRTRWLMLNLLGIGAYAAFMYGISLASTTHLWKGVGISLMGIVIVMYWRKSVRGLEVMDRWLHEQLKDLGKALEALRGKLG